MHPAALAPRPPFVCASAPLFTRANAQQCRVMVSVQKVCAERRASSREVAAKRRDMITAARVMLRERRRCRAAAFTPSTTLTHPTRCHMPILPMLIRDTRCESERQQARYHRFMPVKARGGKEQLKEAQSRCAAGVALSRRGGRRSIASRQHHISAAPPHLRCALSSRIADARYAAVSRAAAAAAASNTVEIACRCRRRSRPLICRRGPADAPARRRAATPVQPRQRREVVRDNIPPFDTQTSPPVYIPLLCRAFSCAMPPGTRTRCCAQQRREAMLRAPRAASARCVALKMRAAQQHVVARRLFAPSTFTTRPPSRIRRPPFEPPSPSPDARHAHPERQRRQTRVTRQSCAKPAVAMLSKCG